MKDLKVLKFIGWRKILSNIEQIFKKNFPIYMNPYIYAFK